MGQKVNPVGFRLGVTKSSSANWYASKQSYAQYLGNDILVRMFLMNELQEAAVSKVEIERNRKSANITVHSARQGVIIGRKGEKVEYLRRRLASIMGMPVRLNIQEVRKPDLDATLVAENIAQQLQRRGTSTRRVMKRTMQNVMRQGALGVKILVSGRLGGAEIARSEGVKEGRVPLHTLRADIDYAEARSKTTYGILGIKVWIFKGEIIEKPVSSHEQEKDG